MERNMLTVERIKQYARTCTIYTEDNPEGERGFIHWMADSAIYCHPVGDGSYTWTANGERVRESDVRLLLAARA